MEISLSTELTQQLLEGGFFETRDQFTFIDVQEEFGAFSLLRFNHRNGNAFRARDHFKKLGFQFDGAPNSPSFSQQELHNCMIMIQYLGLAEIQDLPLSEEQKKFLLAQQAKQNIPYDPIITLQQFWELLNRVGEMALVYNQGENSERFLLTDGKSTMLDVETILQVQMLSAMEVLAPNEKVTPVDPWVEKIGEITGSPHLDWSVYQAYFTTHMGEGGSMFKYKPEVDEWINELEYPYFDYLFMECHGQINFSLIPSFIRENENSIFNGIIKKRDEFTNNYNKVYEKEVRNHLTDPEHHPPPRFIPPSDLDQKEIMLLLKLADRALKKKLELEGHPMFQLAYQHLKKAKQTGKNLSWTVILKNRPQIPESETARVKQEIKQTIPNGEKMISFLKNSTLADFIPARERDAPVLIVYPDLHTDVYGNLSTLADWAELDSIGSIFGVELSEEGLKEEKKYGHPQAFHIEEECSQKFTQENIRNFILFFRSLLNQSGIKVKAQIGGHLKHMVQSCYYRNMKIFGYDNYKNELTEIMNSNKLTNHQKALGADISNATRSENAYRRMLEIYETEHPKGPMVMSMGDGHMWTFLEYARKMGLINVIVAVPHQYNPEVPIVFPDPKR